MSGVAYAIGRSLGYIPGVGIVDQSIPLRVIAEPVVVEQNQTRLIVTQAVLRAFEIPGREHAWPLTITFEQVRVLFANAQAEFNFDTGPNPQGGQKWDVDQDIYIAEYSVHLDYVLHTGTGYQLRFADNPAIASMTMEIVNAENPGSLSPGGGSSGNGSDGLTCRIDYEGEVPSGKMTIRLLNLETNINGAWELQWQPDRLP